MPDDDISRLKTVLPADAASRGESETSDSRGLADGARPPSLETGSVLFGSYEIVEKLGTGGMGAVYRARHLRLPEYRAIKVMNPWLEADTEAVDRFHREARALLEVFHPAIVRCHDLLQDDYGRFFLIMELVEGISLSERISHSPLSPREVRALGARLAGGLTEAHAHGVIHRDLAPDNIMLPEGRTDLAKLIDFGIAKLLVAGEESVNISFKGKLRFASPEQLGYFGGEIDQRSDYYSLGLVLCASANLDFGDMGTTFAEAVEARTALRDHPPSIPAELREELGPLLAFDPQDRPASIEALFCESDDRVPTSETSPSPAPPRRGRIAALLGILAAGIAASVLAFWSGRESSAPVTPELTTPPAVGVVEPIAPEDDFRALRRRLAQAAGRTGGRASISVTPSPVADRAAYRLRLVPDCDCFALVFLLDAGEDRIDLLYPNEFDAPRRLEADEVFEVPSNASYDLEALAGIGIDRIRLILLSEDPGFPPAGLETWNAQKGEAARVRELGAFVDHLERTPTAEWSSAEAALHVLP